METTQAQLQFESELTWCIEQLKMGLQSRTLGEKKINEYTKALRSLENPKAPLPKKRQIMRASFGDYRAKMAKEDNEFKLDPKMTEQNVPPASSQYLRQANPVVFAENSTEPFKFNFNSASEPTEVTSSTAGSITPNSRGVKFTNDNSFRFNFDKPSE